MHFLCAAPFLRKKNADRKSAPFCLPSSVRLLFRDSANGALCGTCSAVDALVGVNPVMVVALTDCIYGALRFAGTAADAFVADFMSHFQSHSFNLILLFFGILYLYADYNTYIIGL